VIGRLVDPLELFVENHLEENVFDTRVSQRWFITRTAIVISSQHVKNAAFMAIAAL